MITIVLPKTLRRGLDDLMTAMKYLLGCLALIAALSLPDHAAATDIETGDGRHFYDCTVLKADAIGLYFRHRSGIARVLYEDLSDDLLADLEPLPEPELKSAGPAVPESPEPEAVDAEAAVVAPGEGFRLVFRQQVVIGVPNHLLQRRPYGCPANGFADVHRYSHFGWRQAVERDFLITTGILPRPPGVVTQRVPSGIRLNYF